MSASFSLDQPQQNESEDAPRRARQLDGCHTTLADLVSLSTQAEKHADEARAIIGGGNVERRCGGAVDDAVGQVGLT